MNSKGAFGGRKSEEFRWILKGFRSVKCEPNNTGVIGRDDFPHPLSKRHRIGPQAKSILGPYAI